jgi:hypothetical protein
MNMKIVKVLFLDDAPWCLPNLSQKGIELEVIRESEWGTMDVYKAPPHVCEAVKQLTEEKKVDLVIVGNNMGAGVLKAQAIAEDMKEKTIVVWNFYTLGVEQPYAAFGLKHFCSRKNLSKMVPKLLGLTT